MHVFCRVCDQQHAQAQQIKTHGPAFHKEAVKDQDAFTVARATPWSEDERVGFSMFASMHRDPHAMLFAILDTSSGQERIAGYSRVKDIDPANLTFSTSALVLKPYRRSHVNTQLRWLALNWAFSPPPHGLGMRRAETHVYAHNPASLAALLRLGFKLEGIKRTAMIVDEKLSTVGKKLTGQLGQPAIGNAVNVFQVSLTVTDWEGGVRDRLRALADRPPTQIVLDTAAASDESRSGASAVDGAPLPKSPAANEIDIPAKLVGNGVTLRPFYVELYGRQYHEEMLKNPDQTKTGQGAVWPADYETAARILRGLRDKEHYMAFAVLDTSSGAERLAGFTGVKNIDYAQLTCETSYRLFPRYHKSHVNTVRRFVLLDFAFAPPPFGLGMRRSEDQIFTFNGTALASALRAGYHFEAVKRDAYVLDPRPDDVGVKLAGQLGQPDKGNAASLYQLSLTVEDWEGGVREKLKAAADRPPAKLSF